MNSDYQLDEQQKENEELDFDYKFDFRDNKDIVAEIKQKESELSKIPFETLLDMYVSYRESNIWNPPAPFKDTFEYLQYGTLLKGELRKRDRKGSVIL